MTVTDDFDSILRRTQTHIRAYIAGLGVPAHEVDDLAQDTYVEFYRNQDRLPADATPERWLKGIARNVCMNHFRKSSRRGRLHRAALVEILDRAASAIDRPIGHDDLLPALEDCLSRLPEQSRRIVDLQYGQGRSSGEMAELLDSTAEAIRVSLFRIRATLKNCIARKLARAT